LVSRQRLLQDLEAKREGVSEGVKSVLRQREQKFGFIRGLVADVLRVDVEHAAVIEAALDGRDQLLVACYRLSGIALPVWPASPNERRTVSWRRFIAEYASAAILMRARAFVGEQCLDGRTACMPLQPTRLFVQPPDRRQLLEVTEPCLPYRSLQHVNGAIVDPERHGKGMPVLAAMSDREPRRITEAVRSAMHDLGDLGQGADRPCTDARHQQKLGEILRTACGRGCEITVQSSGYDVL